MPDSAFTAALSSQTAKIMAMTSIRGALLPALTHSGRAAGQAFATQHANVGYLENDIKSSLGGSTDVNNIWVGSGLSLGMQFAFMNDNFRLIPSIDMDKATGWEVSPRVRLQGRRFCLTSILGTMPNLPSALNAESEAGFLKAT